MKVPAIYVANPYMMSCNEEVYNKMHSVDKNLKKFCEKKIRYEDIKVKDCKSKYYYENERVSKREAKTSLAQEENLDYITEWYSGKVAMCGKSYLGNFKYSSLSLIHI